MKLMSLTLLFVVFLGSSVGSLLALRKKELARLQNKRMIKSKQEGKKIKEEQLYLEYNISRIVHSYIAPLSANYERMVLEDDQGNLDYAIWDEHVYEFIDGVVVREMPGLALKIVQQKDEIADSITQGVYDHIEKNSEIYELDEDLDDIGYENRCASELRKAGWEAEIKDAPDDQDVDIVATKDGITGVFQCKLSSEPVDIDAVKETLSAKSKYKADLSGVISNSMFTDSANELASVTKTYLLHHSELHDFWASKERNL